MPKLPVVSGRDMIKYLSHRGFSAVRQKGDHVILKSPERMVTVPLHNELDRGTLLQILEDAGISRDEFVRDWS